MREFEHGEVEVCKHGELTIILPFKICEAEAYFKGYEQHIPCTPHKHDELSFEVKVDRRQLLIKWRVDGIRVIYFQCRSEH